MVEYNVQVETGEVWNGGTDANVYVTLYGDRGDTGVRQLLHSNRPDKFKKGNVSHTINNRLINSKMLLVMLIVPSVFMALNYRTVFTPQL